MIRRPPRSTQSRSSAASDVYKRQIQDRTDSLQIGAPAVRDDSLERPLSGSRVIYKDTEQVNICIGSRGLRRGHPDRFALAVLDNILGGSMSSRLFQTIREEQGLAYSIYSYTGMMPVSYTHLTLPTIYSV